MLRDSETASVLTSVQRKRVNQRCGFTRGHKQRLWYCPECSREDYMEYRETCWRRLPQIPGASYCPVHRIRLRESGVEFRDINYRLLPTTYALDHFPEPEEDIGNLYQSNFIRLAEDIAWLLNKGFSFSDNEWIKESFLELTGKPLQETLSTRANAKENEKRFEDYLINRLRRECGRDRIPVTIQKQIGTILSIEEAFGTVEEFFLA